MKVLLPIVLAIKLFLWRSVLAFPAREIYETNPLAMRGGQLEDLFINSYGRDRRTEPPTTFSGIALDSSRNSVVPMKPRPKAVRFGSDCSARNVYAFNGAGIALKCEMWMPLGSSIVWYKHGRPEVTQEHHVPKENPVEGMGRQQEFHLQTTYYIDCVSWEDQGNYSLQIITPHDDFIQRDFHVRVTDFLGIKFNCCIECRTYKHLMPRIVEFAKTIVGKAGTELELPCRREGRSGTTPTWDKENGDLENGNYRISAKGDLKISNLTIHDNGFFTCQIKSNYFPIEDSISTFVKVIP